MGDPLLCRDGRIPFRDPPCPGGQVGEGVSPTLDASNKIIALDGKIKATKDPATRSIRKPNGRNTKRHVPLTGVCSTGLVLR